MKFSRKTRSKFDNTFPSFCACLVQALVDNLYLGAFSVTESEFQVKISNLKMAGPECLTQKCGPKI